MLIRIEPEEAEKFYKIYRSDYGHHTFVAYVSAYTAKLKNENSGIDLNQKN